MNLRLLFLFSAIAFGLDSLPAQTASAPADEPVYLPQWNDSDQKNMLAGQFYPGQDLLPGEEDVRDPNAEAIAIETPNDLPESEEDMSVIATELYPLYLPSAEGIFLIDPQLVLTEQERADIGRILEEIKETTGVSVYLTLFHKNQKIPASLNAPSLARQIFGNRDSCILVEYHKNDLTKSQVIYSENLGFCLDDRKRKEILDGAQKKAGEFTENSEVLWRFLYALGRQIPGIISLAENNPVASKINIPSMDDLSLSEKKVAPKESSRKEKIAEAVTEFFSAYGLPILLIIMGMGVGVLLFFWWRWRKIYPLEIHPVKKRLGAPHGSNTSRVIHYGGETPKSKFEQDLLKDFFNQK